MNWRDRMGFAPDYSDEGDWIIAHLEDGGGIYGHEGGFDLYSKALERIDRDFDKMPDFDWQVYDRREFVRQCEELGPEYLYTARRALRYMPDSAGISAREEFIRRHGY